jgi:hypothetical protein
MLGDDGVQISVDHGPVQRLVFADNAVGQRDPALGSFGNPLAPSERQRPQINALRNEQIEGHVNRTARGAMQAL